MAVSDADKAMMRRLARDLGQLERDDRPSRPAFDAAVTDADADRRLGGLPDLVVDPVPPEEEFYDRARALGLR